MLNRRLSDYIFYGTLVLIAVLIFLIRSVVVGGIRTDIASMDKENIQLQAQIDNLEELVQENKDVQTSHLYELYDIIPNVYSATTLTYKTVAMLEQLGIDESDNYNRTVFVNSDVTFADGSDFAQFASKYTFVRVEVTFTTTDVDLVTSLVDSIYNSDQLFIIDSVTYSDTQDGTSMNMDVAFYAIYDIDTQNES